MKRDVLLSLREGRDFPSQRVLHNKSRNKNRRFLKYGSISPKKASRQVCIMRQNNELHSGWLINGGGDDRNGTQRVGDQRVVDHNEPEKLEYYDE